MTTPSLSSLHIYPVKSLRGLDREAAVVEPWGLAGDRRWMLVDASGRCVTQRECPRLALVSAQPLGDGGLRFTAPGQPAQEVAVPEPARTEPVQVFSTKVEAVPAGGAAEAWFTAYVGAPTRLVHMDDPAVRRAVDPEYSLPGDTVSFADGFPLLLTTSGSLAALNSLMAARSPGAVEPLPMNRFRPNVVVDGTEGWAEDGWRRIRIGEVSFRVAKPCGRCVVTTTDQMTADRGKEPLRTLAVHRRIDGRLAFGQNLIPEHRGTLRVGDPLTILE